MTGGIGVDVLVIGSGPIGSAVVRRVLSELPSASVLIVEAGPKLAEPPGVNVRNLAPDERVGPQRKAEGRAVPGRRTPVAAVSGGRVASRQVITARPGTHLVAADDGIGSDQDGMPAAAMSTGIGGMGAHWTCAVPRPAAGEVIPFIAQAEMNRLLAVAEEYLCKTGMGFKDTPEGRKVLSVLTDVVGDRMIEGRPVQPMPLACQPRGGRLPWWTGADTVLGGYADRVELRSETLCRKLLVGGDRVSGAELEDLRAGGAYRVDAAQVVVAADALRTPQLLWASGIRPKALGRYLNDQPQTIAAVYLEGATGGATASGEDARDALTGVCWVPYSGEAHPFHGQVMQLDTSPIAITSGEVDNDPRPVVGLGWFCAKDIRPDDRIEFSDGETDPYGLPAMTIHYGLTDADRRRTAAAADQIRRISKAMGPFAPGGEPRLLPAGSSLHYQGSVRMGPADDGTSVCDPHGLVWGFSNLYVGGNGVIPTPTACNPTLTSVALAVGSADQIAKNLRAASR